MRSVSNAAIDLGGSALEWGLSKVEGLAQSAIQLVGEAATGAVNFVGDTATTAVSTVAETATGAVDFVGDTATSAVNFVEDKATGAVNWVADKATGAVTFVENKATSAVNFVEDKATGAVDWVESKASGVVSTVEGLATGAVDTVENAATSAVDGVEGLANRGIQFVADKANGVIDWVEDKATGVVNSAEQAGIQTVNFVEKHGPTVIEFAKEAFSAAKTVLWDGMIGPALEDLGTLVGWVSDGVAWVNDNVVQPSVDWVSNKIEEGKAWIKEQFPGLVACWELFQSFVEGINEKIRQLPVLGDFLRFRDSINNALGDILEGALKGELIDDPNGWNILGQVIMGFVPYAGQAADIRDLLVILDKMESGEAGYLDLSLALVAFIPGLGDAIKAGKHLDQADEVLAGLDNIVRQFDNVPPGLIDDLFGNPAVRQALTENPEILQTLLSQGDEGVELLTKYGDDAVRTLNEYGDEGLDMLREGVLSRVPTPDGHTIKVTASGRIVRCSTCGELSEVYARQLADNPELAGRLDEIKNIDDPIRQAEEAARLEEELAALARNADAAPEITSTSDAIRHAQEMYAEGKSLDEVLEALPPEYAWVAHTRHGDLVERQVLDGLGITGSKTEVTVNIPVRGQGTVPVSTIPDFITPTAVGEIKAGANVGYTPQIRAQIAYANANDLDYIIYVSQGATVHPSLVAEAQRAGSRVFIRFIEDIVPGTP